MESAQKLKVARQVSRMIVKKSANFVVASAIAGFVPTDNKLQQVQLLIGSYAIADMATRNVGAWSDMKFDQVVESLKAISEEVQKAQANQ